MKLLRRLLVGLALMAALLPAGAARADVAPPPPPRGANLAPGTETTQVRMVSELVTIDIPSTSQEKTWEAGVTAEFQMRNLGNQTESMMVRFPMSISFEWSGTECDLDTPYPVIQNFGARVNGGAVDVTYDEYMGKNGDKRPCWAYFPAAFPPGKDVTIKVTYKVTGYYIDHGSLTNYLRFSYILVSGAGWKDTIGSADIIAHLPYPVSEMNAYDTDSGSGKKAELSGSEVRWHFEDFEPEVNVSFVMMNPLVWSAIQKETETVKLNPQDGEAWGRLGKAYKTAVMLERGFRDDAAGRVMLDKALEAYRQSVTLLPKDADWHYGYGELICWQAEWMPPAEEDGLPQTLRSCIEQMKLALELNPNHVKAKERLQTLSENTWLGKNFLDMSKGKPDYLILTPGNYQTLTPFPTWTATPGPKATATKPAPPAVAAAATEDPRKTNTPAAPADPPTSIPPTVPAAPSGPTGNSTPVCGGGLLLLPALLGLIYALKK